MNYGNYNSAAAKQTRQFDVDGAVAGYVSDKLGEVNQRQAEIPHEMSMLAKAVEFVEHSVNELHQRLDGRVMRPSAPEPTTGEGKLASVGPATGYGQEINGQVRRLQATGEHLQDLLRRLEV